MKVVTKDSLSHILRTPITCKRFLSSFEVSNQQVRSIPLIHHGCPMDSNLMQKINHHATFPANGVSLWQMAEFGHYPNDGVLFCASQFIVEELPIRLARRVQDLAQLPYNLSNMKSIRRVSDWYVQSFDELTSITPPHLSQELKEILYASTKKNKQKVSITSRNGLGIKQEGYNERLTPESECQSDIDGSLSSSNPSSLNAQSSIGRWDRPYYVDVSIKNDQWPIEVQEYNIEVTRALQKIKARHDRVVATIAQGVVEWKESEHYVPYQNDVQNFLDKFYMSRIGIRMLIRQHISLNMDRGLRNDYVGIICTNTNVKDIVSSAVDTARYICEDWYGIFKAPQVLVHSNTENINFKYVPGHLSHILFEVIKNSLRAVVETYGIDSDWYPPVKVVIAQGEEDITIKISDEGGGIPRANLDKVWTYMYTTADGGSCLSSIDTDSKAPMAGFGYGLPLSRLYAQYFGGDLKIISMEGYGTDVYLHLNRLSTGDEPI